MAKKRMGAEARTLLSGAATPGAKNWKDAVGGKTAKPAPRLEAALFKVEPAQRQALREAALKAAGNVGRMDASRIVRHLIAEWMAEGSPLPPAEG